jgi:hypothetical protein
MANKSKASEIVDGYMKKWNHLPAMTLAKKIYNENVGAFTNIEQARSLIRVKKRCKG